MHERIDDILKKQERDDGAAARSDSEIEASVRREFVNSEELLAAAKARNVRLTDFFAAEQFPDLPVLPRRTADTFGIRKHTASQRPYLHTQDFYELIYVSRGRCAQTLPNSRPLLLQAGQAALLAPGCTHNLARARENDVIVKLVIPPPLYAAVSAPDLAETECVCVFTPRRETFEFFLWGLLREQNAKDGLQTKTIPALLTLLFAELYRAREAQLLAQGGRARFAAEVSAQRNKTCGEGANPAAGNTRRAAPAVHKKFTQKLAFWGRDPPPGSAMMGVPRGSPAPLAAQKISAKNLRFGGESRPLALL